VIAHLTAFGVSIDLTKKWRFSVNPFLKKTWISPFIGCSFLIIAISGVLMFFHVKTHSLVTLHEWMGLIFVLTATLHLILNWKKLISYLSKRMAALSLVVVLFIAFFLIALGGFKDSGQNPDQHRERRVSSTVHR
jgi:hypothetical protein